MIDPVTGWFKIIQYNDKRVIPIANLVEAKWLYRYPRPMEITYYQGSEFIGDDFRKPLIEEEYGMTAKPITLGNPTSNAILERIHQVIENLVWAFKITKNYIGKDDPRLDILDSSAFEIFSTSNWLKGCSPGQLLFSCGMFLPIKNKAGWGLIHQQNQTQITKNNVRGNI